MSVGLFDSHCHLDPDIWESELDDIIARARDAGVTEMTTIGSDDSVKYAQNAVEVASKDPKIYATVGIHPHSAKDCTDDVFAAIAALSSHEKVVGIGETGLDYHYDLSPRPVQKDVFRRFIGLAHERQKALVIHVRNAFDDCLQILEEENARDLRVVIHCFTGTKENAFDALDLGCWISIPGIVTFKNAGDIPLVATETPADRLLIETDCPYLAPAPKRGKKNEPAFLKYTAQKVAELRGIELALLSELTTANARTFYGIE